MSRSRQKGTYAETAVVSFLNQRHGFPAERRALSGNRDKGDVAGLPGVVIEVKNEQRIDLAGYVAEANIERDNAGADYGFAWIKKRGTTDPGKWYVLCDGDTLVKILKRLM